MFLFNVGETYELYMYDEYGDGWNGNTWTIPYFTTTLEPESSSLWIFEGYDWFTAVPVVYGCTDATACNYEEEMLT